MANYISVCRSNYFRVENEGLWKRWLGCLCGVEDFTRKDKDGTVWHGFGCYGSPWFSTNEDEEEVDGDIFCADSVAMIQKFIAEDDALIYIESGHEKLRYVAGVAVIVTRLGVRTVDLVRSSVDIAGEMLGDPDYQSRCDY